MWQSVNYYVSMLVEGESACYYEFAALFFRYRSITPRNDIFSFSIDEKETKNLV